MRNRTLAAVVSSAAILLLAMPVMAAPQEGSGPQTASPLVMPDPPAWEDRPFAEQSGEKGFQASEVRRVVAGLSRKASATEVELALYELLPQIYQATRKDLGVVGEAVAGLREQPAAAKALAFHYQQLPTEALEQRLATIGILGELRKAEAMPELRQVVWTTLPPGEDMPEGLSSRDVEEIIQAKAVQGLAYLGSKDADAAVREVIVDHESLHVRVSAIDAYMWNHNDSPKTAEELYKMLPEDMHSYVERPRFHQGMDVEEFSRRLSDWREKWATEPEPSHDDEHGHQHRH